MLIHFISQVDNVTLTW